MFEMSYNKNNVEVNTILENYSITHSNLLKISEDFCDSICDGLCGKPSPFKMLRSYVGLSTGTETGEYIAVDFGGTNLRVLLVDLMGGGSYRVLKSESAALKSVEFNFPPGVKSAERLFDFISSLIQDVLTDNRQLKLGFSFSFPSQQNALNSSRLIEWTKEIRIEGVEGKDINFLLEQALIRKGLHCIHPVAIINDTTGTLLAAAYQNNDVEIASICGTGHNICYYEKNTNPGNIINLQTDNFYRLPANKYDDLLDTISERPGQQRMEKMVSGQYLGELFRLTCKDLNDKNLLFGNRHVQILEVKDFFTAKHLSAILSNNFPNQNEISRWLASVSSVPVSNEDVIIISQLARKIAYRSAALIGASLLGVLKHIDPVMENSHTIAVDGSIFEKMPGYITDVESFLNKSSNSEQHIKLLLTEGGSAVGAAIAASMA